MPPLTAEVPASPVPADATARVPSIERGHAAMTAPRVCNRSDSRKEGQGMRRLTSILLPLLLLPAVVHLSASAQYAVRRSVVGGGGGRILGASRILSGTAGQSAIGRVTGSTCDGSIGFWYPVTVIAQAVPEETTPPERFALGPGFPSPAGPTTTLRFAVPRPSRVAIRLYDVTGREVRTLLEGELPPGDHTIELDGAALAAGIYFCRLTAPAFSETRRLVLVK
jgi:hypothetical protein